MKILFLILTLFFNVNTQSPDISFEQLLEQLAKDFDDPKNLPGVQVAKPKKSTPKAAMRKLNSRDNFLEVWQPSKDKELPLHKSEDLSFYLDELEDAFESLRKKISSLHPYYREKFKQYDDVLNQIKFHTGTISDHRVYHETIYSNQFSPLRNKILTITSKLNEFNRNIDIENKTIPKTQGKNIKVTQNSDDTSWYNQYVSSPLSNLREALVGESTQPKKQPKKFKPQHELVPKIGDGKSQDREQAIEKLIMYTTLTKMAIKDLMKFFDTNLNSLERELRSVVDSSKGGVQKWKEARRKEIEQAQKRLATKPKPQPYKPTQPYFNTPFQPQAFIPSFRQQNFRPSTPVAQTKGAPVKKIKPPKTPDDSKKEPSKPKESKKPDKPKQDLLGQERKLKQDVVSLIDEARMGNQSARATIAINRSEVMRLESKLDKTNARRRDIDSWINLDNSYREALSNLEIITPSFTEDVKPAISGQLDDPIEEIDQAIQIDDEPEIISREVQIGSDIDNLLLDTSDEEILELDITELGNLTRSIIASPVEPVIESSLVSQSRIDEFKMFLKILELLNDEDDSYSHPFTGPAIESPFWNNLASKFTKKSDLASDQSSSVKIEFLDDESTPASDQLSIAKKSLSNALSKQVVDDKMASITGSKLLPAVVFNVAGGLWMLTPLMRNEKGEVLKISPSQLGKITNNLPKPVAINNVRMAPTLALPPSQTSPTATLNNEISRSSRVFMPNAFKAPTQVNFLGQNRALIPLPKAEVNQLLPVAKKSLSRRVGNYKVTALMLAGDIASTRQAANQTRAITMRPALNFNPLSANYSQRLLSKSFLSRFNFITPEYARAMSMVSSMPPVVGLIEHEGTNQALLSIPVSPQGDLTTLSPSVASEMFRGGNITPFGLETASGIELYPQVASDDNFINIFGTDWNPSIVGIDEKPDTSSWPAFIVVNDYGETALLGAVARSSENTFAPRPADKNEEIGSDPTLINILDQNLLGIRVDLKPKNIETIQPSLPSPEDLPPVDLEPVEKFLPLPDLEDLPLPPDEKKADENQTKDSQSYRSIGRYEDDLLKTSPDKTFDEIEDLEEAAFEAEKKRFLEQQRKASPDKEKKQLRTSPAQMQKADQDLEEAAFQEEKRRFLEMKRKESQLQQEEKTTIVIKPPKPPTLLEQIQAGKKLKPVTDVEEKKEPTLLEQIQKGLKLKPAPSIEKKPTESSMEEIFKRSIQNKLPSKNDDEDDDDSEWDDDQWEDTPAPKATPKTLPSFEPKVKFHGVPVKVPKPAMELPATPTQVKPAEDFDFEKELQGRFKKAYESDDEDDSDWDDDLSEDDDLELKQTP